MWAASLLVASIAIVAQGTFDCTACQGVFQARMLCCAEHEKDGCKYNDVDAQCEVYKPPPKKNTSDTCTPSGGRCHSNQEETCCDYSTCVIMDELGLCTSMKSTCSRLGGGCQVGDMHHDFCCTDVFLDHPSASPHQLRCMKGDKPDAASRNGVCEARALDGDITVKDVAFSLEEVKVDSDVRKSVSVLKGDYFLVSLDAEPGWTWTALENPMDAVMIDSTKVVNENPPVVPVDPTFQCSACSGVWQAIMFCCAGHEQDGCEYNNRDGRCEFAKLPPAPHNKTGTTTYVFDFVVASTIDFPGYIKLQYYNVTNPEQSADAHVDIKRYGAFPAASIIV